MVRGCQKKIIYLKNTHSDMFEEAYFVIKDTHFNEQSCECDMVKEATKILSENFDFETEENFKKRCVSFLKRHTITFLCGIIVGILVSFII